MIYIIGLNTAGRRELSQRAMDIIMTAGLIAGGRRHIAEFPDTLAVKVPIGADLNAVAIRIEEYLSKNTGASGDHAAILATGDPLIYGIGAFIVERFKGEKLEIIPNVSVIQEAFARIKERADGLKILSAHGRNIDIDALAYEIAKNERVAILTDRAHTPAKIASKIMAISDVDYRAYVCESIGSTKERISAADLKTTARRRSFADLNVLILIRNSGPIPAPPKTKLGIPDALLSHSDGMITKEEIRVISLSKLDIRPQSVVWDIGAGCGSIAVEAAKTAERGHVYAIEKDSERITHIKKNLAAFGAHNLDIIEGLAPACIRSAKLPRPDAVFIGGGGRDIIKILRYVSSRIRPGGTCVVNAVTMETANAAFEFFKDARFTGRDLALISLSKAKGIGSLNLLSANNPVFIISARRTDER